MLRLASWFELVATSNAATTRSCDSSHDFAAPPLLQPRESRSHPATTDVLPMKSEKREEPRERAQTYASPRQKPTSGEQGGR